MRTLTILLLAAPLAVAQTADWKLGTLQTTGILGFNVQNGTGYGAQPTIGMGFDVGLSRNLAITTAYAWSRVDALSTSEWILGHGAFRDTLLETNARESRHDLLGGLRLHVPTRTRVTPYVAGLCGVVVDTANVFVNGGRALHDSIAKPAGGVGAGFEFRLGRGFSFLADGKAIRALDLPWYGHVGFGIAFRPEKKSGSWF